jgi:hypothetical protein
MRLRSLVLVLVLICTFAAAGCGGGGSLGTVPRGAAVPLHGSRQVVVPLHGRVDGRARLRPADGGQKTALGVTLEKPAHSATVEIARGRCARPTSLTALTVFGSVESRRASWTVPTPFAQLAASEFVVVVRSGARAVEACGSAKRTVP